MCFIKLRLVMAVGPFSIQKEIVSFGRIQYPSIHSFNLPFKMFGDWYGDSSVCISLVEERMMFYKLFTFFPLFTLFLTLYVITKLSVESFKCIELTFSVCFFSSVQQYKYSNIILLVTHISCIKYNE
ncbi:unnamed protein product [Parnassius mnemosyne]|uniref:Uncharacterized protein n=1 Tax=Parnassius mnemosyne TaxID=213953 RepID=A0AAV1K882_9NEOP